MLRTRLLFLFLIIGLPLVALPKLAQVGMSAILPGSGEILLGKPNRGAVMMTADLVSLALMLQSSSNVKDLRNSYKRSAEVYAGATSSSVSRYYQDMQNYRSSEVYNSQQEMMARNYYLIYMYEPDLYQQYVSANTYPDELSWEWTNEEKWKEYRDTRGDYQEEKLIGNLLMGAMILNRLISMIDVSFINPPDGSQSLYISPIDNEGLMLNYKIGF